MQFTKVSLQKRRQDLFLLWHPQKDTPELLVTIASIRPPTPPQYFEIDLRVRPLLAPRELRIRKNHSDLSQVLICIQFHIVHRNQRANVVSPLLLIDLITMARNLLAPSMSRLRLECLKKIPELRLHN